MSTVKGTGPLPLRVRGVGRMEDEPRALLVCLTDIPSDHQLRSFHEFVLDWTPLGPPHRGEETGWVIEREDSEPSRPMYWAGFQWEYDNLKAIRYARKEDAQKSSRYLFPGEPHRIADHMWCP